MILMLAISAGWAAKLPVFQVVVTDQAGSPVSNAIVRFDAEGERHRVRAIDGNFESAILTFKDGSEHHFDVGSTVSFWVSAAGYGAKHLDTPMDKKKVRVPVVLEPFPVPVLSCASAPLEAKNGRAIAEVAQTSLDTAVGEDRGCAMAAIAWGRVLDWWDAEAAYPEGPSGEADARRSAARRVALEAIRGLREWMSGAGADVAGLRPLCLAVAGEPGPCD